MVYSYFYSFSRTLTWTYHKNDELCVIVVLRLTVHSAMYWHEITRIYDRKPSQSCSGLAKGCFYVSLMHQYFMGEPLLFSTCLQRFALNGPAWQGGHGGNERLDQLSLVSRMALWYLQRDCARDFQSDSDPGIEQASLVSWSSSGTSIWWPAWHDDMVHCQVDVTSTGVWVVGEVQGCRQLINIGPPMPAVCSNGLQGTQELADN